METTVMLVHLISVKPMSRLNMITQDRLKDILSYSPDTGVFRWLATGSEAGGEKRSPKDTTTYRRISIDGSEYRAHRVAFLYMTGAMPDGQVDHIDGNGLNNAWSNLRDVSQTENQHNRKINRNNLSGVAGVGYCNKSKKWRARISDNGKRVNLGRFDSMDDAVNARKSAEFRFGYNQR